MPPMNSVEQLFTGIFGTLIFVLALVVVIYWLVFPIIVARYLKDMLQSQRKAEGHSRGLRRAFEEQDKRPVPGLPP
jgi:flagellar biogenesis protein FliO